MLTLTAPELEDFARASGIHSLGWYEAANFSLYLETIRARKEYHGLVYRSLEAFLKAGRVPEGLGTVIVLVMDYFAESSAESSGFRVSNYGRTCWNTVNPKADALIGFLRARGHRAERLDLPQRASACRAGLGFIGRNALFYAHGLGSYVGIASVGTDAALGDSVPRPERITSPRCGTCGRCVKACPVGALPEAGYAIDPLRCLSMINRHPDEPLRLPPGEPEKLEGWVYGCETCQNVCPLNAEARHRYEAVVAPEIVIEGMRLPNAARIPRACLEERRATLTSPGYRDYLKLLLREKS